VRNVTKDRLVEALNAIQNGRDAGEFHDELETIIGIMLDRVSQDDIDMAYAELREDTAEG
jgi:hypothetical protein